MIVIFAYVVEKSDGKELSVSIGIGAKVMEDEPSRETIAPIIQRAVDENRAECNRTDADGWTLKAGPTLGVLPQSFAIAETAYIMGEVVSGEREIKAAQ